MSREGWLDADGSGEVSRVVDVSREAARQCCMARGERACVEHMRPVYWRGGEDDRQVRCTVAGRLSGLW